MISQDEVRASHCMYRIPCPDDDVFCAWGIVFVRFDKLGEERVVCDEQ